MAWKSVYDVPPPEGVVLVLLNGNLGGMRIHTGRVRNSKLILVGGLFAHDLGKTRVIAWDFAPVVTIRDLISFKS